jgi:concanavalin A-like lectin/glucanase superfamily protein
MAALCVLALPACTVLFPLVDPPADAPIDPPGKPAACKHDGLLLCLAFEDRDDLGRDDSADPREVASEGVNSVTRKDGHADELALDLTASSLVLLSENDVFDLQDPMSIDLWFFYPGRTPDERILFDNHQQYAVTLDADADAVRCQWTIDDGNSGGQIEFGAAVITRPSEWHHVACTYDGTTVRAYLDGDAAPLVATRTGTIPPQDKPPRIGQAGDSTNPRLFIGQLDNVRVWTHTLDPTQIDLLAEGLEAEANP